MDGYQGREELDDELYKEDESDSEGSLTHSELEFHLYSQLHYFSNFVEREEQDDGEEKEQEIIEMTNDDDGDLGHTNHSTPLSAADGQLQQHPKEKKKKGENRDKQKGRKSDPEGQKASSSSVFEEVIVNDSSSDVICISEDYTADSDDGVCALKGQSFHRVQTSTPAQQETQKGKRSLSVPVTVVSSSSDLDSEESESSDSSDSDSLEDWMILGRGQQDADHTISLNLEGGPESSTNAEEEGGNWLISDKDEKAQIYNKDRGPRTAGPWLPNRYFIANNARCRNCNKIGHLSKNCPDPTKVKPCFLCGNPGHLAIECPSKHCNNCGLPGHGFNSCSEKAYWHKQCYRCGMTGHFADACPEIWRQYHMTTKSGPPKPQQMEQSGRTPSCYNCGRRGHFGHACTHQRMFKGVYPCTQFIQNYDTVSDINQRQHRIKFKFKELKKNGYIPTSSQTPATPGPPKKKQKISHHDNNHTPHQTPNNHKPNRSHIFFNDSHNFSAATPKMKKFNKCKQQQSIGKAKPWKPKRPVPTSRDPLPPAKLIVDEAEDFPRGGGTGESMQKKKKKKKKMNKMKLVPLGLPEGPKEGRPDHLHWNAQGKRPESKQKKGRTKKKKRDQAQWTADKLMYPTDENLFAIKQRKRRR